MRESQLTPKLEEILFAGNGMKPDELRWLYIKAVLIDEVWNVSATARRLGMHRKTLQRIISTHSQAQLNTTRE